MLLDEMILELQMLRREIGCNVEVTFLDCEGDVHYLEHCQRYGIDHETEVVIRER